MQDKMKNEGFSQKLRQAIAEAHPREVRLLAIYINNYLKEDCDVKETFTGRINDALEAFGGGAES